MKKAFGKGPETVRVFEAKEAFILEMEGFLTKVEKIELKRDGGSGEVRALRREVFMEVGIDLAETYGLEYGKIFLDVRPEIDSSCMIFIF